MIGQPPPRTVFVARMTKGILKAGEEKKQPKKKLRSSGGLRMLLLLEMGEVFAFYHDTASPLARGYRQHCCSVGPIQRKNDPLRAASSAFLGPDNIRRGSLKCQKVWVLGGCAM